MLNEAEKRMRVKADTAEDGVILINASGTIPGFNPALPVDAKMGAEMPEAQGANLTLDKRIIALERELTDFSYIVSHDIGAPLRHIEGLSELLRRSPGTLSEEFSGFVDLIRDAAQKGSRMTEQLLDYSRLQQAELNIVTCDVNHMLEHARFLLGTEIGQSHAEVISSALGNIEGDRDLLTQALLHVLGNAIKFRRPGIRPCIAINAVPDGDSWIITVQDNGIGVNIAEQERLFWMFGRGKTQYPGHGTGLTIARRIMRRHGGDVRFVERDGGACVKITMPRPGLADARRAA
jgi:signal transduction histidine kinase